jgi:hypothetical protein
MAEDVNLTATADCTVVLIDHSAFNCSKIAEQTKSSWIGYLQFAIPSSSKEANSAGTQWRTLDKTSPQVQKLHWQQRAVLAQHIAAVSNCEQTHADGFANVNHVAARVHEITLVRQQDMERENQDKTILVIDDNCLFRAMMKSLLEIERLHRVCQTGLLQF